MFDINESIKPISINSVNSFSGIGYITIPDLDFIDRDQFVEDCYRTNTVTIFGGIHYGYFYNVSVESDIIKKIVMPKEKGQYGSPVIWVNVLPWNKPVIIGILKYDTDIYSNTEGQYNFSKEYEGNHIDSSFDCKKGTVDFNLIANKPKIKVCCISENEDSEFDVYNKGIMNIHSTQEIQLSSDKKISFKILDENNNLSFLIDYEIGKGFEYKDEFDNNILISDGKVKIASKKIIHNEGNESMVLGDTLADLLSELIQAISTITVTTAVGISTVPNNVSSILELQQKIKKIKSETSKLS